MKSIINKVALLSLLFTISGVVKAGIIDHSDYTEDTDQNLYFLDLGLFSPDTFANLKTGVSYAGYQWSLSTVDQFTQFLGNATGTSIPTWNGSNLGDIDLNPANLSNTINLLSGSSNITPWFTLDGQQLGQAEAIFHTGNFNDVHLRTGSSSRLGLFVRTAAQVPEPSTLAIFALGMIGLASRRFKKQS
ncbi:PEP-CTERM sorting domain-containing protein [Colwellia hornerae]|uniref:PEP-CTERM sorting domain-containing protein n=1 Tax=Colwellia hornerae TaxID=89402 RepID=UPI001CB9014B|nr:PEP-CTERM sorting domain-containing protein [Colwellia hornerae]